MADLYPTKTRLELLRGVERLEVAGYPPYGHHGDEYYQDGEGRGRKVTTRIEELMKADWVRKGTRVHNGVPFSAFRVELTDAGRKVLEEADRG